MSAPKVSRPLFTVNEAAAKLWEVDWKKRTAVCACLNCGKMFEGPKWQVEHGVRKYCSLACSTAHRQGPNHQNWKGDAAGRITKRARAQRRYKLSRCEKCRRRPAIDRHHKDDDTGNNEPENIQLLCRRCHMEIDGRLPAFVAAGGFRKPKNPA